MEMSLCGAGYRFMSYLTERSKLTDPARRVLLVSGSLHAALFGSVAYPQSSGLRRLAMEVCVCVCVRVSESDDAALGIVLLSQLLRNYRRKDLDELSVHIKSHEQLKPSAVTAAGTVIANPHTHRCTQTVCVCLCASAGCVFCTPTEVPFPAHLQTPAFQQVLPRWFISVCTRHPCVCVCVCGARRLCPPPWTRSRICAASKCCGRQRCW